MNSEQRLTWNFPSLVVRRPLSFLAGAAAVLVILAAVVFRIEGHMLIGALDNMDTFTPVMISILILRGLYAMRHDTDLQAVSMAMIAALSFIFIYEAIYKVSFYITRPMPPAELREFIIQCGIALTAVSGFAFGKFHFSRWSRIFAVAFVVLYAFWMLAGYPQVQLGGNTYWAIIPVHLSWDMAYVVNRGTKALMFLTYLFFYSGMPRAAQAPAEDDAAELPG